MNKPRQAKFVSVQILSDNAGAEYWVATDSAGRRFRASTKKEAIEMLNDYNHIKPTKEAA